MKATMWWLTVTAYWIVVLLCLIAVKRERPQLPWKISALFFALATVNKQHDLTGYLTRFMRRTAALHDWYGERRAFQWHVIAGICIGSAVVLGTIWVVTSRLRWSGAQRLTLFVAVGLLGFAGVRSVSLHGIDHLIGWKLWGVSLNWMIEFGGLFAVVVTVLLSLLRRPSV